MARLSGKTGNVKFDTDGNAYATMEGLLGVTGWTLNTTADTPEATGMDSSGAKAYLAGNTGFAGSVNFHWETTETDYVGNPPILRHGQRMEMELYVLDDTVYGTRGIPDSYYQFDAIVTGFDVTVAVEGSVDGTIAFQGTETLTHALAPV